MATGAALCVLHLGRSRGSVLLLGLLAAGLAHAVTSRGDCVSHNRLAAALLPLAVLTAVGFDAIRLAVVSTWRPMVVALLTAALIVAAGWTIFAVVTPKILPASWLATSLEALGTDEPNADAVFLEHGGKWNLTWLYIDRIAALVPVRRLPVLAYGQLESQQPTAADALQRVYFWSPGLEGDAAVSRLVCDRWPQAALYTLVDESGMFTAFAASPRGATWHPRLPAGRWTVSFCEGPSSRQ